MLFVTQHHEEQEKPLTVESESDNMNFMET